MTSILIVLILILLLIPSLIKEQKIQIQLMRERNEIQSQMAEESMLASDFFRNKENLINKGYSTPGIYIITNTSRNNRRYIGQSVNIVNRVQTHLRGRGNIDIYNHILGGDTFVVDFVRLKDTEYQDLNSLESYLISKYDTYYNGYNKTRGNKR